MKNYLEEYKVNVPIGKSGNWVVDQFTIEPNDHKALYYALHGRPIPEGTYTRLSINGRPIMSDTPAEIDDHLDFIYKATGNCLINGLGLGVVLKAILQKPEVTHIDVVEIEQDVINLVWPTYQDGNRVTLHHADAYTIQFPKDTIWDCAWHDIWGDMCSDNLPDITKLKRKYARKVKWQRAWAEEILRYHKRRDDGY